MAGPLAGASKINSKPPAQRQGDSEGVLYPPDRISITRSPYADATLRSQRRMATISARKHIGAEKHPEAGRNVA